MQNEKIIIDNDDLALAVKAVKKAGLILKENFGKHYRILRKSHYELVSEIDLKAQRIILETLTENESPYGIITEEKRVNHIEKKMNWIIDPLDGTHNYIAGLPFSGISIGLADGQDFIVGVIYFPMEDQLYYAARGRGAYLNGQSISVSDNRK
ncbi:inositol monophosphatase family protein, partial [candidate division CSSED10-310 bacterium]